MRKVAFLVANDTFPEDPSIPPLRFTQNDASALAKVLEDPETCGFDTRLFLTKPHTKSWRILSRFLESWSRTTRFCFITQAMAGSARITNCICFRRIQSPQAWERQRSGRATCWLFFRKALRSGGLLFWIAVSPGRLEAHSVHLEEETPRVRSRT